jgi:hypothetical protein
LGTLLVPTSRKAGEPLFLKHLGDRYRAEALTVSVKDIRNVINGAIVFPQFDHPHPDEVLLWRFLGTFGRMHKEFPFGTPPELMGQDAEATFGVTEPSSHFLDGDFLHEIGPKGFVLPVGWVGRLKEKVGVTH